jgi:hypothetical protein
MKEKAFQECYPEDLSHCYGCGRLNEHGHHIRATGGGRRVWPCSSPEPFHMAMPGFVYGGLISSLVDATPQARARLPTEEGRAMDSSPPRSDRVAAR